LKSRKNELAYAEKITRSERKCRKTEVISVALSLIKGNLRAINATIIVEIAKKV
jgi:hypothetical protein